MVLSGQAARDGAIVGFCRVGNIKTVCVLWCSAGLQELEENKKQNVNK